MNNLTLELIKDNKLVSINLDSLVFVDTKKNYCDFHLEKNIKEKDFRITITEVMNKIDALGSFADHHITRVGRGLIINTRFLSCASVWGESVITLDEVNQQFQISKNECKKLFALLDKQKRDQLLKTYGKNFFLSVPIDELNEEHPEIDGHEYVDLGLPSGNLWSTKNLNCFRAESSGHLYQRNDKTTKESLELIEYKGKETLQQSVIDSYEITDDIVKNLWRSQWQMPTQEDFKELFTECTTVWCRTKGRKYGVLLTGKNSNSMFIAADKYDKIRGYYWTVEMTQFACPTTSIIMEEDRDAGDARVSYGSHAIVEEAYIRPIIHVNKD